MQNNLLFIRAEFEGFDLLHDLVHIYATVKCKCKYGVKSKSTNSVF